jgi:hypothetical protein
MAANGVCELGHVAAAETRPNTPESRHGSLATETLPNEPESRRDADMAAPPPCCKLETPYVGLDDAVPKTTPVLLQLRPSLSKNLKFDFGSQPFRRNF